ncbi:MAG TPA: hypothetical protein PK859_13110 [Spirochaetota bacterium]|nr:hypothetical protein [Spirochaetota bacterium]HPR49781.1 hypothetical protein [Spirochaetota bacterium]
MSEQQYIIIFNRGAEGFDIKPLDKKDFVRTTASLFKRPKKIFLGLGDFLEVGDYNILIDSLFFDNAGLLFENILDKNNRKLSDEGNIPVSFFKLGVYYPDFLLKNVPTYCVSLIGKKSRLFPGAETFVKYIKEYDPTVLSAMPEEIAIEFVKRLDLDEQNLISTEYKIQKDASFKDIYSGDIGRFISGDRKSLEIEKIMAEKGYKNDEVAYIGRGEAGAKTFSTVNSIAFNPSKSIIPESRINIYGSSLEALLVLFNFDGELEKFLLAGATEDLLPSLVVYSESREKSDKLIEIEMKHCHFQNNIIGQRIEHSGDSYDSVRREIEIAIGGSTIDIQTVREQIGNRLLSFRKNPQELVRQIYGIARERYKNFCTV